MSIFYLVAFLSVIFSMMTILTKNPIHSVLYLIITFFTFTIHYILLNAQFLAIVNFIVYMGAIMVLFLFVLMLLNLNKEIEPMKTTLAKFIMTIAALCLLITLLGALKVVNMNYDAFVYSNEDIGLVQNLGKVLLEEFLLPFEMSALMLLTAIVGAVLLAKNDKQVIKKNG